MAVRRITVENTDSLVRKLGEIAKIDLTKGILQSALLVERNAKQLCPVDTGVLRASITHKVKGNQGEVYTNLYYAPHVEKGTGIYAEDGNGRQDVPWVYVDAEGKGHTTSGQEPQPFLKPALVNNEQAVIDYIKHYFIRKVEQIVQ